MHKLTGKLRTFTLNTDNSVDGGEKYFVDEITFGLLRKYAQTYLYNHTSKDGEQRQSDSRHLGRLKKDIVEGNYTPQCFNLSITDLSIANVDDDGNVVIPLYEDNKLAILDGGTRFAALETIRNSDPKYVKPVDMLPIPIIVYLEPEKRKEHFTHLNNGKKVNNSHLQVMKIAGGKLAEEKLQILQPANDLSVLLEQDESSPLYNKITYGAVHEDGKIQFSQLVTDHKACLVSSLYGSIKILNVVEKDIQYFKDIFTRLYDYFVERTEIVEAGKLLALPPNGPKGNAANWLSLVNCVIYYLYLQKEMDNSPDLENHINHIIDAAKPYDNVVAGDTSRNRIQLLSQAFAQRLFKDMEDNPDCPCGVHFGIPIPLIAITSHSSFKVEALPALKKNKKAATDA